MKDTVFTATVQRAMQGDAQAIEWLCEQQIHSILYLCIKIMGNQQDGEDAAQEVLLLLQRDIVKLEHPEAFSTWLRRVAVRCCQRRKSQLCAHSALQLADCADALLEEHAEFLPEVQLERKAEHARLVQAMHKLPEDCRTCLMLFYYEDYKYREIAQSMGVSTTDVGNLLAKGKKLLREQLLARPKTNCA